MAKCNSRSVREYQNWKNDCDDQQAMKLDDS